MFVGSDVRAWCLDAIASQGTTIHRLPLPAELRRKNNNKMIIGIQKKPKHPKRCVTATKYLT